jgi:hypothetical protein
MLAAMDCELFLKRFLIIFCLHGLTMTGPFELGTFVV